MACVCKFLIFLWNWLRLHIGQIKEKLLCRNHTYETVEFQYTNIKVHTGGRLVAPHPPCWEYSILFIIQCYAILPVHTCLRDLWWTVRKVKKQNGEISAVRLKKHGDSQALPARCLRGSWSRTPCPSSTGRCPAPGSLELWNQQAAINACARWQSDLWDPCACTRIHYENATLFKTHSQKIQAATVYKWMHLLFSHNQISVCLCQHVNSVTVFVQSFVTMVARCTKTDSVRKGAIKRYKKKDLFWLRSVTLELK